jgi:hypothetical protein
MPAQDTSQTKERIISILRTKGPSLPVHIARELDMSILFASAFLSELVSEKKIKVSDMKVGSSPLYLIPGQEFMLEKFAEYLKSREKEAFLLLKDKKFLKDNKQEPAIKVALRQIKDYAIPFKDAGEIYWRYFKTRESDFEKPKAEIKPKEEKIEKDKELGIFDKKPKKKITRKPSPKKKNDKFFNRVKEHLSEKSIEIIDIEDFSRNDLFLRVRDRGEEKLLAAFNKKKIDEKDIIKANKKATELNVKYIILSLGEPLKKLKDLVEALKRLSEMQSINNKI